MAAHATNNLLLLKHRRARSTHADCNSVGFVRGAEERLHVPWVTQWCAKDLHALLGHGKGSVPTRQHCVSFPELCCRLKCLDPARLDPPCCSTPAFSLGGSVSWCGSTIQHRRCCICPRRVPVGKRRTNRQEKAKKESLRKRRAIASKGMRGSPCSPSPPWAMSWVVSCALSHKNP